MVTWLVGIKINVSQVIRFLLGGAKLVRIFGQNCTYSKENYCILWIDIMPKMNIQIFFMKRIIWMFLKLIFIQKNKLRWTTLTVRHFLITSVFKRCTVLHLFPLLVVNLKQKPDFFHQPQSYTYIPSTINIWKKVLTKAIRADKIWASFC